jgi:ArsR family transcriptional regulator
MGKMNNDGSGAAAAENWFRALGDGHRLQILDLLAASEMNAGELLEQVDVVQSTLSHHMKTLCESGLVRARRNGKWTLYTVDREIVSAAREYLCRYMEAVLPKEQTGEVAISSETKKRGSRPAEAAKAEAKAAAETAKAEAKAEAKAAAEATAKTEAAKAKAAAETAEAEMTADTISYDTVVRKTQVAEESLKADKKKAKEKEKAKDKGKDKSKKSKDKDGSRDKSKTGKNKDKKKKKDNRF